MKQDTYHFIYKTTNLINNKFYIGMHSTNNLDDRYFGSGKLISHSVRKYGIENHKVEILEFLTSRDELKKREFEIVSEELLANPLCINLKRGGNGGYLPKAACQKGGRTPHSSARSSRNCLKLRDSEIRRKAKETLKKTAVVKKSQGYDSFFACREISISRDVVEKKKQKFAEIKHQQGEQNSQFGTCWVCNDLGVMKIKKEELQQWLDKGWRKGRK